MKKLKNFIAKKKREAQGFRGEGYSLSADSSSSGAVGSVPSGPQRLAQAPPQNTEERRMKAEAIAEAANRRLNPEPTLTYAQKKIQMQAKRELEEERKRMEAMAVCQAKNERKPQDIVMDGVPGVLYTCDLFDDGFALPKLEMIEAVDSYLRSQLGDEGVEAAVIMIYSLNGAAKYQPAVETMKKYLQNVVDKPHEPKFRRIRLSNKVFSEKVAGVKGAVEFLRAVGFVDEEAPNENGAVEKFLVFPEPTEEQVFRFDPSRPLPKPHISPDFFDLTADEIKREQQARTEQIERMTTLMTSKMRQEGNNRTTYKYTLIRIRFPNNYVLQGVFSVHEQVGALREFVSKHLGNNFGVFVFNDSGVKIDDDTKSLAEYGLVPAAALHFDWDEETMALFRSMDKTPTYLDPSLESKSGCLT